MRLVHEGVFVIRKLNDSNADKAAVREIAQQRAVPDRGWAQS